MEGTAAALTTERREAKAATENFILNVVRGEKLNMKEDL